VKEQSHKEEMSAAIRGDFQRLRARGVSAALVPQEGAEPSEPVDSLDAVEHAEPSDPAEQPPVGSEPEPPPGDRPPESRGWLARLAGR
jgi:hypothetical protein